MSDYTCRCGAAQTAIKTRHVCTICQRANRVIDGVLVASRAPTASGIKKPSTDNVNEKIPRICMRCRKPFEARTPYLRRCDSCRKLD